ncbi:MAG: tetratricopeptide repeat protein [Leeuwenhoekiella sp.]
MKTRILMLIALAMTTLTFAQKRELRDAEKALEDKELAKAESSLQAAEALMGEMKDKDKEEYYFIKGKLAMAKDTTVTGYRKAFDVFEKVYEVNDGDKYGEEVKTLKIEAKQKILQMGSKQFDKENFKDAAIAFEEVYNISPTDTVFLYNAAISAIQGQHYDMALSYYERLRDMNYDGSEVQFVATNKESGEEEPFNSKQERDLMIQSGEFTNPKKSKTPSKRPDIYRFIALIYNNQGQADKALEAYENALETNPGDTELMQQQAFLFRKQGMTEKYKEALGNLIEQDPNNPQLYFQLGLGASEAGDEESAQKYYKKALEIDPDFGAANQNYAVSIMSGEQDIIDKMNALGNSAADNKKYEAFKKERMDLYKEAMPYYEKALENEPDSEGLVRTLYNINLQLGNDEQAKKYKTKLDTME